MNSIAKQGIGLFLKLHRRKGFSNCVSMSIEDENHLLLECLDYTHIRFEFHSICYNTNIYYLLTCQNYSEPGKLLGKFFEHMNKILK